MLGPPDIVELQLPSTASQHAQLKEDGSCDPEHLEGFMFATKSTQLQCVNDTDICE